MTELTLEQVHKVMRDLNSLEPHFDPPLDETETDMTIAIFRIQEIAPELTKEDKLKKETKEVLNFLKVGPWLKEPIIEEAVTSPKENIVVEEIESYKVEEKPDPEPKYWPSKKEETVVSVVQEMNKKEITVIPEEPRSKNKNMGKRNFSSYTRAMAFADALREGARTENELIKLADEYYQKKAHAESNIFTAKTVHFYSFSALKAFDLIKEKEGKITIR